MTTRHEGSVHGRFQPFHLGHAEYLGAAAARCEFLWIGITQPEVTRLQGDSSQPAHRYRPDDNPLAYWERARVIEASLLGDLDRERFAIVPFPIERPEALQNYVPVTATAYTTVYDEWNRRKIDVLISCGYEVEVLWEREKKVYAGSEVRRLMRLGDDQWRALVPANAAQALDDLGLPERLQLGPAN
jgi:nicotinamide mononucleotide adenylyltransferase